MKETLAAVLPHPAPPLRPRRPSGEHAERVHTAVTQLARLATDLEGEVAQLRADKADLCAELERLAKVDAWARAYHRARREYEQACEAALDAGQPADLDTLQARLRYAWHQLDAALAGTAGE